MEEGFIAAQILTAAYFLIPLATFTYYRTIDILSRRHFSMVLVSTVSTYITCAAYLVYYAGFNDEKQSVPCIVRVLLRSIFGTLICKYYN